jgi:hypothetical protein
MSSRSVPPPSDDYEARRLRAELEKKLYQVQELEQVDEEARPKKRFQSMMQPADDKSDETEPDTRETTSTPSPYETSFRTQTPPSPPPEQEQENEEIPTFAQPMAPQIDNFAPSIDPLSNEEKDLPISNSFYQTDDYDATVPYPQYVDDTSRPPTAPSQPQEKEQEKGKQKLPNHPMMGQKKPPAPSPFMPTPKKGKTEQAPHAKEMPKGNLPPPKPAPPLPHPGFRPTAPLPNIPRPKEQTPTSSRPTDRRQRVAPKPVEPEKEAERKIAPTTKTSKDEEGTKEKKTTPDILPVTQTPLPADVQPLAIAATVAAQPYLSPEVLSLYHQMVGTIFVMSGPKGVSRTEFVLNNPKFANSKFYGSSIEITRYSTAPNSFNIQLSGNTQAVDAFLQYKGELQRAFEKQGINIGQLQVNYKRGDKGEGQGHPDKRNKK